MLVGHLRARPRARAPASRIEGGEQLDEVVVVEPHAARAQPALEPGHRLEGLRRHPPPLRRDAARRARSALAPGWFSFNVPGGRCEACEGTGEAVVDMQFLDDVRVPCEACGGTRYRKEARAHPARAAAPSSSVLDLTIDEARERASRATRR